MTKVKLTPAPPRKPQTGRSRRAQNPPARASTAPRAHYFGSFFSCEKSQSFVAIWNDFPNLAQFFERPNLVDQSSPIRAVILPNSSVCWDLACVFHVAGFEKFWNVRVLLNPFAVQKVPAAESEYPRTGTKNLKTWKKAMFRRMAHASRRTLCKEKRP